MKIEIAKGIEIVVEDDKAKEIVKTVLLGVKKATKKMYQKAKSSGRGRPKKQNKKKE